jgi:prolyl oligopeptidase
MVRMHAISTRLAQLLVLMSVTASIAAAAQSKDAIPPPPPAPPDATVDTYHGVKVEDPYRWLEDSNDARVKQWSTAQNERARQYLDGLPYRKAMFERLMKQASATSSSFSSLRPAGGRVFARHTQPPRQQPMIAVLGRDLDPAKAQVIVDPNSLDPKGATAVDWFVPSPDGKLLAVSMSLNGSEDGSLHVFDVATRKEVEPVIPRVQYPTAGGSLAWRADCKGFWYTRFPGPDRPAAEQHFFQQIYFHKLGDAPAADSLALGKDFPKIAEVFLDDRNPRLILASVANGDGGQFAHYLIDQAGKVTQITRFTDQVVAAAIGPDDAVYLVSRNGAPRGKVLKLVAGQSNLAQASVLVPESEAVIQTGGEFGGTPVVVTPRGIYVREIMGGPSRVAIFDAAGRAKGSLPLPDPAAVAEVHSIDEGTIAYSVETFLRPPYFSRYDEKSGQASETKLTQSSPVSFPDVEVIRELATSRDGTKIPLNIIRRKGTKLDGSNPVLLYGYGGYGDIEAPYFVGPSVRLWLDGGGIYAIANLRGGGEYGEEWHAQGALTHKQNVFDDFYAAAQYLVAQKYTSPQHLGILGASNGGLLMGAELTQHPQMFRAVATLVGIYDMMRVERDPNGAFNTTEFGSTADPEQFKALLAYSPYHHVVKGTQYPAVFMATGENDGRVNPMHSRKMIARLQAANASNEPILLTIESRAGHGIGSALSVRMNQSADFLSFLFDQLGMRYPAGY